MTYIYAKFKTTKVGLKKLSVYMYNDNLYMFVRKKCGIQMS